MRNLMIHHHLGLGDHFICNGLVRYLYESLAPARLFLPAKHQYFHTVSRMYMDAPGIIPVPVHKDTDVVDLPQYLLSDEVIRVGFSGVRPDFDVSFYDASGVPFVARWTYFKAARDPEQERKLEEIIGVKPGDQFILIHDVSSVGRFHLATRSDLRKIFVSPLSSCMLDWSSIAEKAEEVHCIDSSFIHLAQTLNVKCGFFHKARPTLSKFVLKEGWRTVDYKKRTLWLPWGNRARA